MSYTVKLPDVGEGVAEAELVEWHVAVGDEVTPDTLLAEVLTDKATVEIYPPVGGTVAALHGEPGDVVAVGSELVTLATGEAPAPSAPAAPESAAPAAAEAPAEPTPAPAGPDSPGPVAGDVPAESAPEPAGAGAPPAPAREPAGQPPGGPETERAARRRALAAPAVRARARALGIDLTTVAGSGPAGRVEHADLDRLLTGGGPGRASRASGGDGHTDEPVRGLRRKIAERMSAAWADIPHITYVDAVDATELEKLRGVLNARPGATRLTLLPFIARAIVLAVAEQPRLNAHYDAAGQALRVFDAVHVGIATQTDDGLAVPVVRHAETRSLADLAVAIARLAEATRSHRATRDELSGSTITITSLGALGGLVSTPIINAPEVAIVGINKLETRPVWADGAFVPRQMFNISASFDHRVVDGWDAAVFVQRLRSLLETPALLFAEEVGGPI